MRKQKPDYFAIWLGITIVCAVILIFLVLISYWPDFFRDMTFVH